MGFSQTKNISSDGGNLVKKDASGNIVVTSNISAATYGSDGSITDAEFLYINTLSSNAQTALDVRCLESVFGTSIGTGIILDGTSWYKISESTN